MHPIRQIWLWSLLVLGALACRLPAPSQPTSTTTAAPPTAAISPATRQPLPTLPSPAAALSQTAAPLLDQSPAPQFLGEGVRYTRSLGAGETATYAFADYAAADLILLITASPNLNAVLTLKDSAGSTLATVDDGGLGEPDWLRFSPPSATTYTLEVSNQDGSGGDFQITLANLGSPRTQTLFTAAESVGEGALVRHRLGDVVGVPVLLLLQPAADFDAVLEIYAPEGIVTSQDRGETGEAETALFVPASAGYVAVVAGYLGEGGSYELTAVALP